MKLRTRFFITGISGFWLFGGIGLTPTAANDMYHVLLAVITVPPS